MNRRDLLKLAAALPALASAEGALFFNPHQFETMTVFSDLVIPGSAEALVTQYLDKLLAAADTGFQTDITGDLELLDQFAQQRSGEVFVHLDADQQTRLLEEMMLSGYAPTFDRLKAWSARMYYATEAGFNELNRDGRIPGTFACG
jgi:hypothetical protein